MANLDYAFTWLASPTLGAWNINVVTEGMPQKVATAFSEAASTLLGAEYTPIAYLGSQMANGINHAVVAEQTIVSGKDHKNIVLMKFNENGMECHLFAIEPHVQEGGEFGGYVVNAKLGKDIDSEAIASFNAVMDGFVGSKVELVAQLATKVVKGINYVFLATVTGVYPDAKQQVKMVTVNSLMNHVDFADVL